MIYLCDIDEVPEFNTMYELFDPMTIMFFYRNKHMMFETIYKGAKKGRGLVVSPKGELQLFSGTHIDGELIAL